MSKHATVRLGDFTVPLIGIAPKETEQQCAKCKKHFHLQDVKLDIDGKPLCKDCRK